MPDFADSIEEHKNLSVEDQKKAGQAIAGDMGDEHTNFLKTITLMIKEGEIDCQKPETFLKRKNYDKLSEEERGKVDLAMVNLADLLRHLTEFYLSKQTPDSSPHLETMIEQLWEMKDRVEKQYGDVFKF